MIACAPSEPNEIFLDNPAVYDGDEVVEDDNGGVRTIPNSCRPAANNHQRQLHKNSEGSEDYSESYSESDSDTGSWLQKRDNLSYSGRIYVYWYAILFIFVISCMKVKMYVVKLKSCL